MTAREVLDGIKAEAEGLTDLCPEHLRQSIRHVQRNCDIECNEHPNGDPWCECHQPDRYDGERMAKSLGNIERLTRAVEAVLGLHTSDGHKNLIGPYCEHCISPIDGGPELWPCATVKAINEALNP